jgi:UDP-N-acetylglucosamine--N-acetylmuramyl-(pentapeptide) pyrophosphoryl-undecaprenol N-acetylglucosamine transferase
VKVLFAGGGTGGHLYPALALADAVRVRAPAVDVHVVGATRGVETRVLPAKGVPHTLVPVLPLDRSRPWRNWRLVPSLARSFAVVRSLFRTFRPQLVVGTGGYASAPACLYAAFRGIPMAVQEQNAFPGRTTKLLARWASQIHLGFPEAARYLKPRKGAHVFTHGNPIVAPDTSLDRGRCRVQFGLDTGSIVALIVGGSQGGRGINETVLGAIERVQRGELERTLPIELLWATGTHNFESMAKRLAPLRADWVHAVAYIDDMPRALAATDLAISRAGAMMTGELQSWGIPTILVPLPTSAEDHQTTNAQALAAAGAAEWTAERDLTPESLWALLTRLAGDDARRASMSRAARARIDVDAADAIARDLLTLLPAGSR